MAGLLRYQIFLSYGIIIVAFWYTLIQNKASIINETKSIPIYSSLPPTVQEAIIDYLPLWMLICLGLYAVGSIAYGVANLADCPDAAKEVEKHIKEAKDYMKKRGIIED